jgi:hypothetical protein
MLDGFGVGVGEQAFLEFVSTDVADFGCCILVWHTQVENLNDGYTATRAANM